jgi:hypothetical protein
MTDVQPEVIDLIKKMTNHNPSNRLSIDVEINPIYISSKTNDEIYTLVKKYIDSNETIEIFTKIISYIAEQFNATDYEIYFIFVANIFDYDFEIKYSDTVSRKSMHNYFKKMSY